MNYIPNEAYLSVGSEITHGKKLIAQAINAKGGSASTTDSFSELAQDIQSIQTQEITIDGGQMYANQMTGDGVLWDLYTILVQMKSQFMINGYSYNGVLYKYSALIVCEYYKGYDSLVLQGADAYFTCDGDFYNYASPNHLWHDSDNGKMNRWVCFLFTDDGARLDITNTTISPRSMYIGGHIGTIEYFVNGGLTDLVCGVEDTDVVDNFYSKGFTQEFGFNCILRNIRNYDDSDHTSKSGFNITSAGAVIIEGVKNSIYGGNEFVLNCSFLYVSGVKNIEINALAGCFSCTKAIDIRFPDLETATRGTIHRAVMVAPLKAQCIYVPNFRDGSLFRWSPRYSCDDLIDLTVGSMIYDLNMQNWTASNILADPDKTSKLIDNIKNHILARVSDATGSTQLVFTVSTNLYNAIANENIEWEGEAMTLADAFLTKNWLFAGA